VTADTPSPRERWARIDQLFHRALDLPPGDRASWLERIRHEHPDVADAVISLVAAHERAGAFLESSVGSPNAGRFPTGTTIGPYEIQGVIGHGGMGVVYLANDTRLGRTVALKALRPEHVGNTTHRERFRREAQAAASLHHPGIATVFALEEIQGQAYIATEYVPGETLRDEIARGPLPLDTALDTALAIARALAVAHHAGIVHRDLKPENVVRGPGGVIKILDFGLARLPREVAPAITQDGSVFGTPAYMSPEQIRGLEADARSDLFALGVILYELLTATHPFLRDEPSATLARVLESTPPPVSARRPGLTPPEIDRIVAACLSKDPAARPASAEALGLSLERIRAGATRPPVERQPSAVPPLSGIAIERARWWWRFHQAAVTVGYGLLLAPLWQLRAHVSPEHGRLVFLTALVAAIVASALRLHLWFADDLDPSERARQHDRSAKWIRLGDWVFVAVMAASGVLSLDTTVVAGVVLVAGAAAALVSCTIIEPSTTRAAFARSTTE
jgi:serine/threonine-protein kinase